VFLEFVIICAFLLWCHQPGNKPYILLLKCLGKFLPPLQSSEANLTFLADRNFCRSAINQRRPGTHTCAPTSWETKLKEFALEALKFPRDRQKKRTLFLGTKYLCTAIAHFFIQEVHLKYNETLWAWVRARAEIYLLIFECVRMHRFWFVTEMQSRIRYNVGAKQRISVNFSSSFVSEISAGADRRHRTQRSRRARQAGASPSVGTQLGCIYTVYHRKRQRVCDRFWREARNWPARSRQMWSNRNQIDANERYH